MSQVQAEQEKDQKIRSIHKALDRGEVDEDEANAAILTLETGITQFITSALRPEEEESVVGRLLREREEAKKVPSRVPTRIDEQEVLEVARQLWSLREGLDPETQGELDEVFERQDLTEMRKAISTLDPRGFKDNTAFLQSLVSAKTLSTEIQKVVQEALDSKSVEKIKATADAMRLVQQKETEAIRKAAALRGRRAKTREEAKQDKLARIAREKLGVKTFSDFIKSVQGYPYPGF